jgi:hypothetical protein
MSLEPYKEMTGITQSLASPMAQTQATNSIAIPPPVY